MFTYWSLKELRLVSVAPICIIHDLLCILKRVRNLIAVNNRLGGFSRNKRDYVYLEGSLKVAISNCVYQDGASGLSKQPMWFKEPIHIGSLKNSLFI